MPGVRISAVKSQTENVAAVAPNVAVITGFQAENVNTAAGVVFEFEFDAAAQALTHNPFLGEEEPGAVRRWLYTGLR